MFGWEGDSLQRAIDARCDYPDNCSSELTIQDYATANACVDGKAVVEDEGLDECESDGLGPRNQVHDLAC